MRKVILVIFLVIGMVFSGVSQVNVKLDQALVESVNNEFEESGLLGLMRAYHDPSDLKSFNLMVSVNYSDEFWEEFRHSFESDPDNEDVTDIYKAFGYTRFMFKFKDDTIKYIYF